MPRSMTRILPLNSLNPRASDQSPIATDSTSPAEVIPSTTAASKSAFEEIWKKSVASHSINGHVAKNPANERNRAVAAFSREPVSAPQALRQRALRDARPAARRQPRKCPPTTGIIARRTTSRAQAGERRLPNHRGRHRRNCRLRRPRCRARLLRLRRLPSGGRIGRQGNRR